MSRSSPKKDLPGKSIFRRGRTKVSSSQGCSECVISKEKLVRGWVDVDVGESSLRLYHSESRPALERMGQRLPTGEMSTLLCTVLGGTASRGYVLRPVCLGFVKLTGFPDSATDVPRLPRPALGFLRLVPPPPPKLANSISMAAGVKMGANYSGRL